MRTQKISFARKRSCVFRRPFSLLIHLNTRTKKFPNPKLAPARVFVHAQIRWRSEITYPSSTSVRLPLVKGLHIIQLKSFEALNQIAVAVGVDPIKSVKGKVVIDAFRMIN
ncbi:26S proteasome non-ATPase regulatory subunit 14 [Forsythia ovata]|uniref:26S proteasome non-ATPase regulatory subunit 14 n=1 Tax=Forsythia ovata TaxID=205694 RepID=A0ABD1W8W1_9LAMI